MGRPLRAAEGGRVYHCMNRANARLAIFTDDGDFAAFERVLAKAVERYDMRLLAYCVRSNHFHLEEEAMHRSIRRGQPFGTSD